MTIELQISELEPPAREELALICPGAKGWRPKLVLSFMGPAYQESETLVRLLLACCVVEGPLRIVEFATQIEKLCQLKQSALKSKLADPQYEDSHPFLSALITEIQTPRVALKETRARLSNTVKSEKIGITYYDIRVLLHYAQLSVWAYLFSVAPNAVGVKRSLEVFHRAPALLDCEEWLDRVLPSGVIQRCLLFEPADYSRVVLVYKDGLLAYDPLFVDDEH